MNAEAKIDLQSTVSPVPQAPRRAWTRRILMWGVPLAVLVAGASIYLHGGRFISTDNAYIKANISAVSPEVAGQVEAVLVKENQAVKKDQPVVVIDSTNAQIMMAGAEAQIRTAIAGVEGDKARYRQKLAEMVTAQSNVGFAEREYQRQEKLAASNFVATAKLDEAKHALESARQRIVVLKQEQAEVLARLEGNPDIAPEQHPAYLQALTMKASAQRNMQRATVVAPFDGVVSQLPERGDYARTGAPIFSIVATDTVWVEANFKETDLTHMQLGQPATVRVDAYPGRVFHGKVASISQATGAEFSVLPAQNSSGNWVKVVQRIPVRISIDDEKGAPPLRAGMSVDAEIDTGHRRAESLFAQLTGSHS